MLEKNHILQSQKNPKEPNPKNPKPKATSNQKSQRLLFSLESAVGFKDHINKYLFEQCEKYFKTISLNVFLERVK